MTAPRVPERRVHAEQLVAQVNARAGTTLVVVGTADHGESGGAVYAAWPDGRTAVITRSYAGMSSMRRTADVLNGLRDQGAPVPRHDLLVPLADDAIAVVQERLPGIPAAQVGPEVIDRMVEASELFVDALNARPDIPERRLHLGSSGSGFLRHETLQAYGPRSRALLERIREIGRGDRWLSVVGLRFEMAWSTIYPDSQHPVNAAALDRLDEHLVSRLAPEVLLRYWAHWTLSRLDWTISNFPTADIELFLDLGESRLIPG